MPSTARIDLTVAVALSVMVIGETTTAQKREQRDPNQRRPDAIQDSQTPRDVPERRPEQQLSEHDQSDNFKAANASPASPVFDDQPGDGKITGFDFYRDPLNAPKPFTTLEEIMEKETAARPMVMAAQRELLEQRYNLEPTSIQ